MTTWIGTPVRRVEDPHLLAGAGRFAADIEAAGVLHAAFVRSPIAAGRIAGTGASEAESMSGVQGVYFAADLGLAALEPRLQRPEFAAVDLPILASDAVRHAGEPVAVVLASSPYIAEDAAEAVYIDYEASRAVASIEAALAAGAPLVHAGVAGNLLLDVAAFDAPDIDEVLARSAVSLEMTLESARLNATPLEARACLAQWDRRASRLVVHLSTQVPHLVRLTLASLLGLPENRIRVVSPDVGGGFGQKCVIGREEMAIAALAVKLKRPVRWIEDRNENLQASFQGHEQRYQVRAGFDSDGRLTGIDADILCDIGAYHCYPMTCGVEVLMASGELPGIYKTPRYRARSRGVATNKPPMAPYRGVSRPQLVLAMERLMQKAARRLGISEVEIRRRNLVQADEFPYRAITGLLYDRGSYTESLAKAAGIVDYEHWRERQAQARSAGRLIGLGISCFAERSAYGSEVFAARKMALTPGYENAHIRMDGSGSAIVSVSTHSHGQGHATTFAQVAADQLGIDPRSVIVRYGDTDETPPGWGTYASRSLGIAGSAVKLAAAEVAGRLRSAGAHLLEVAVEDTEIAEGQVRVKGSPGSTIDVVEVARIVHQQSQRIPPGDRHLEATATYDPPGTFSNATHIAEVEVDAATGAIAVRRYVAVEDCGVVINPLIVEGQVQGGVAQGIAAALFEELRYDVDGQPLTTSLMDYLLPTAAEIPHVEIHHLETPSEHTATGAKGMGEGGFIGAPAAIVK